MTSYKLLLIIATVLAAVVHYFGHRSVVHAVINGCLVFIILSCLYFIYPLLRQLSYYF